MLHPSCWAVVGPPEDPRVLAVVAIPVGMRVFTAGDKSR
jgi:hypothetical protein